MVSQQGIVNVTFILQIFYFRNIRGVLNSKTSVHMSYSIHRESLLAKTLNSPGIKFTNIREN